MKETEKKNETEKKKIICIGNQQTKHIFFGSFSETQIT